MAYDEDHSCSKCHFNVQSVQHVTVKCLENQNKRKPIFISFFVARRIYVVITNIKSVLKQHGND
jgi:hypothetical protein